MISAAEKLCGGTKGTKKHKETWECNKEVSVAVRSFCLANDLKSGLLIHGRSINRAGST